MNTDGESRLLAELEGLLEKQISLARRGSFGGLEKLAGQCEPVVVKIKASGLLEKPQHKQELERLAKFYRDIQLLLSAQKDDAAEQLKSIRKSRKMLAIYHGSI
jgi:hypothetical protein